MSNHNNPDYYRWHPSAPECYKVAQEFPYNLGNALTYIWRAGRKPGNDAVKDLEKAVDHLRFEIERLRGLDADRNRPAPPGIPTLSAADVARLERSGIIQRFADEVKTWPLEKVKAGLPQPETVRRAEERARPRDFRLSCGFCDATLRNEQRCPHCFPAPESGCAPESLCTNKGCQINGFCKC